MHTPVYSSLNLSRSAGLAPALIAVGLAVLLAQGYWSAAPVVTAMALIALGASFATVDRCRRAAALRGVVAMHLGVYATLYVLFVGAVCDAAFAGRHEGFTLLQGLDLAVSAGIMALVVRLSLGAMSGGEDAPAR